MKKTGRTIYTVKIDWAGEIMTVKTTTFHSLEDFKSLMNRLYNSYEIIKAEAEEK